MVFRKKSFSRFFCYNIYRKKSARAIGVLAPERDLQKTSRDEKFPWGFFDETKRK